MRAAATEKMKWGLLFSSYGIDIDPKGQTDVTTLWTDNWMKDADGNVVAKFFTGFGAAWGAGASGMGGTNPAGSRLPKTFRLTYYDYLEDKFYQLDGELPLETIYELFQRKTVDIDVNYGKVRQRFEDLRFGIAPGGNVMLWATGLYDYVELRTYQARVLTGMTRASYNAQLPGGTFRLTEDRWQALAAGKLQPATLERIRQGWLPDANWYMRTIRVKFPWRFKVTGNVSRLTELEGYFGSGEAQSVRAWEMSLYQVTAELRGVPNTVKLWFTDLQGDRHHLWVDFSLRERAVSEDDLSEVWAAFRQLFPGRQLEDNATLPSERDMALVEVNITPDFKGITASLVRGNERISIPVGRTQHFALKGGSYFWKTSRPDPPELIKLFLNGPQG